MDDKKWVNVKLNFEKVGTA